MRRSVYLRRRRFQNRNKPKKSSWYLKLVITVLLCGFFIFISAILLGNYLRQISQGGEPDDTSSTKTVETTDYPDSPAMTKIIGKAVDFNSVLEAETTASIGTGTDEKTSASPDYNALSILLRYPSSDQVLKGTGMCLAYTSPMAVSETFDIRKDINLRDGIAALRLSDSQIYISGVFFVSYPEFSDDSRQDAIREYEKKLVCELFEYGVNDVVLLGYGDSQSEVAEALKFADEIVTERKGSAYVGIGVSCDFYSSSTAYDVIKSNTNDRVFFALDLYNQTVPKLMTPEAVVYSKVNRIISLTVTYNIRVVCGCGENPDNELQISEAMRGGASNVQGVKK